MPYTKRSSNTDKASTSSSEKGTMKLGSMVPLVTHPSPSPPVSVKNPPKRLVMQPLEEIPIYQNQKRNASKYGFDWVDLIKSTNNFVAASVTSFKHVPLANRWNSIVATELKVEVNVHSSNLYWLASVIRIEGYRALLRFEGLDESTGKDFWVNMCGGDIHHVGWCAGYGKSLSPPDFLRRMSKVVNWHSFLAEKLTGGKTLPNNFHDQLRQGGRSRFRKGMNLEMMDKANISQVRVASIVNIVGRRLHIMYQNAEPFDEGKTKTNLHIVVTGRRAGFWCHEESPLIHPPGWALSVGHPVTATNAYKLRCSTNSWETNDAPAKLFIQPDCPPAYLLARLEVGMKLEAVDPLDISSICVASVVKVLAKGYIMIRVDSYKNKNTDDSCFCYHLTSPCLFPVGFCQQNDIELKTPTGYEKGFNWQAYLKATETKAVPTELLSREPVDHGFEVGMRLEAADVMEPRLICVAQVTRVIGRLLRIHFDGWEDIYDQWLDCMSPDMYPVGWCEVACYKLESPPSLPQYVVPKKPKRYRRRGRGRRGRNSVISSTANVTKRSSNGTLLNEGNGQDSSSSSESDDRESLSSSKSCASSAGNTFTTNRSGNIIPRIVDSSNNAPLRDVTPSLWSDADVELFLQINDCNPYCEAFRKEGVDGAKLLTMSYEVILAITGKVGPCLKISAIIDQLKARVNPSLARFQKAQKK